MKSRKNATKTALTIGIFFALFVFFFRDTIVPAVVGVVLTGVDKALVWIPTLCYVGALLFLMLGVVNKHGRAISLIAAAFLAFLGFTLSNDEGFEFMFNIFYFLSGDRPPPNGWK